MQIGFCDPLFYCFLSHTARLTIDYLTRENPSYLTRQMWPATSPDLNPMDYRIWAILEQKVYDGVANFKNVEDLKNALNSAWQQIDENTVKQCILGKKGFRARLKAVVNAQGGHIETDFRKC